MCNLLPTYHLTPRGLPRFFSVTQWAGLVCGFAFTCFIDVSSGRWNETIQQLVISDESRALSPNHPSSLEPPHITCEGLIRFVSISLRDSRRYSPEFRPLDRRFPLRKIDS